MLELISDDSFTFFSLSFCISVLTNVKNKTVTKCYAAKLFFQIHSLPAFYFHQEIHNVTLYSGFISLKALD